MAAVIKFTLPTARLDHDPEIYLTYDPTISRPTEDLSLSLTDLRPELEGVVPAVAVADQLNKRGFAVAKHTSGHLDGLPHVEGTKLYLAETAELLRTQLGCTRVIAWNSVCRKNDASVELKDVPKQKGPEEGFVPTERKQPIAGVAHVDQDEVWGAELVDKATGGTAYVRAQIVNIWRPLSGPVTNAPLAMLGFGDIGPDDLSKHASMFGVGMDLHHSQGQQWAYIHHQLPDEVIYLKCFDSFQGSDGSALYCGHVAVEIDDTPGVDPDKVVPRESVEVRLVALWE